MRPKVMMMKCYIFSSVDEWWSGRMTGREMSTEKSRKENKRSADELIRR